MTEKNVFVDRKFVCNWLIYRWALEKLHEVGYSSEDAAALFAVAEVPEEYIAVPEEVINQFMALDLMLGGDENDKN